MIPTLTALRQDIDCRLAELYREQPQDTRLVCAIRYALLSPGKRMRPLITLLAYSENGGPAEAALDAACAIEMVHAASLIMDDLPAMDDARLRRGRLATHAVFGESTGMLASVALLNDAYRVIACGAAGDAAQKMRAICHLASAVGPEGLAGGQERDIMRGATCTEQSTIKEVEARHSEKTGALFAAAAAVGAELAGANAAVVDKMRDYGVALGLAYQAFDDMIDAEWTAETAGKDVAQDNGKSTVVSLLGDEGARHFAARRLQRAIEAARAACAHETSLLADLAVQIGATFGVAPASPDHPQKRPLAGHDRPLAPG